MHGSGAAATAMAQAPGRRPAHTKGCQPDAPIEFPCSRRSKSNPPRPCLEAAGLLRISRRRERDGTGAGSLRESLMILSMNQGGAGWQRSGRPLLIKARPRR